MTHKLYELLKLKLLTATNCVKDKLDIVVMSRITLLQTCLG